jgi:hypothetical protein
MEPDFGECGPAEGPAKPNPTVEGIALGGVSPLASGGQGSVGWLLAGVKASLPLFKSVVRTSDSGRHCEAFERRSFNSSRYRWGPNEMC